MNSHISRLYLCPNCDCAGNNSRQCDCGNAHGLLNLSAILNRDPVAAECGAIMNTFREVMNERLFA